MIRHGGAAARRSKEQVTDDQLEQRLGEGIMALNLAIDAEAIGKLVTYMAALVKWSRIYNLTSVRKPMDILCRHILDSLAVVPYLHGKRLLDLGTGAGLPGIPLALARPDLTVTLLDSSGKKLRFVRQVVADLQLDNVRVRHSKMEDYHPTEPFDTVVCRAFSSLGEIIRHAHSVCSEDGCILAMKGVYPMAEVDALDDQGWVKEVASVTVPGLDAERHIVILAKP